MFDRTLFKKSTILTIAMLVMLGVILAVPNLRSIFRATTLTTGSYISQILPFNKLSISERQQLVEENNLLQSQSQVLSVENKRLENELGLLATDTVRVPVRLAGGASRVYGSTYILDDKRVSMYEGKYVYARGDVLVGSLGPSEGNFLKLNFLGIGQAFIAEVLSTGEIVELTSSGIGFYKGTLPKSSQVAVGETIVMKGFPKAIVGTVSSVETDSSSLTTMWVRAPINLLKTEIFYVDPQ
jgi:hypothetical protein